MKLKVVSLNRDAKLPLCIRWHAKTYGKKAHITSTLRGKMMQEQNAFVKWDNDVAEFL